jgi:exosortase
MKNSLSDIRKLRIAERLASNRSVLFLAAASGIIIVSFYAPFVWMLNQWFVVEEYSPGPAVPILASIALWHALKKNDALPRAPRRTTRWILLIAAVLALLVYVGKEHPRFLPAGRFLASAAYSLLFVAMTLTLLSSGFLLERATPRESGRYLSWMGLALVLFSLAVHFLAVRGDLPRASIVAYVALLFAIIWYAFGWRTARRLAFPYAMLLFMVPVEFIDETLGVPLRLMATQASVGLMRMVGLEVVQTGNWFAIGSMEFAVDAPCSGLKSLIALTALGATFAYVTQPTFVKKLLLAACAIPIAILTNIARLACIGIFSQLVTREFAISVFHDHAAVFLYILAILIFMSLDKKVFQAEWFKVKNF